MPTEGETILPVVHYRGLPAPFAIYADYEAVTEKIHTFQPNGGESYTRAYQHHTDCGYAYKLVCYHDDKYSKPIQVYRGPDAAYKFLRKMLEEVMYCRKVMKDKFNRKLIMSEEDKESFRRADSCHICCKNTSKKK